MSVTESSDSYFNHAKIVLFISDYYYIRGISLFVGVGDLLIPRNVTN